MNRVKLLALAVLLAVVSGCRDEDLNPVKDYETAIHGWGRFDDSSPRNFVFGDASTQINIKYQWNSIDGLNKVSKIEFYAFFDEAYTDSEGNSRLARHVGRFLDANGGGVLFKTLEGAAIPANRTDVNFTVGQSDLYNLFKDLKFDYNNGNGEVPVFNNPVKPDRSPDNPFVKGDAFEISWIIYGEDGRKFDFWSESICSEEFPKSSCSVKFGVVCISELAGEFDYVQTDMVKGNGGGGDPYPGETSGTISWTKTLDANGNPVLGSYDTPDLSFGQFAFVWGDSPATNGAAKVKDACNTISTSGTDQYGDSYSYSVLSVNGPELTIRWVNTYGDAGTVKLTRKDGADWPPLKG